MARKTSRGRQRIAMEKVKNQNSLQVTFSKRRSGIMKKCNELSTLTGAEMAVVIFSPGNRAFSFGNPSIETILNRFQNLHIPSTLTERMYQLHQEDKLKTLNEKIDLLKEEHEAERKLKGLMDQISEIEEKNNNLRLEAYVENLNEGQLQKLKDAFQELNQMAEKKVENQNINQEIQREPFFRFQNVFEHPHDALNIENVRGGYMPTFADNVVSGNVFGGGGFRFIQGEPSSSINNGVQMNVPPLAATAPTVGSFVLSKYPPI